MGKPLWMLLLGLTVLPLATLQWAGATDGKTGAGTITANNALFLDGNQGDDWPGYGRTFGEQHFSPLSQINDRDVGRLKLA